MPLSHVPDWLVDTASCYLLHDTTDPEGFQARLQALESDLTALALDMDGPPDDPRIQEARQEIAAAAQAVLNARSRLHTAAQLVLASAALRS